MEAGTRIGHYEILTPIGRGGMGEVWKARDTRLHREVAIKSLPADLSHEPRRLARLQREAELLATLNHPHIATIHGLEEQDGTPFLVLEMVEGITLEDRIARGRTPVTEALGIALQIAQAVEAAHAKGIVHRDLKPANVLITPDKRVKILDFGIAKATAAAAADEGNSRALDPTREGAAVGTPAYMSPEQARGEAVGVQTDIWAFGAVLYEMLTGASPFRRKTTADTLACVLHEAPQYEQLPGDTPEPARRLVRRCLEKDCSQRLQHMGDVRILVEEAVASLDGRRPPAPAARPAHRWPLAASALAVFLAGGASAWWLSTRPGNSAPVLPVNLSLLFEARPSSFPFATRNLAVSADGSTVAFTGGHRVWIRRLDQPATISVPTGSVSNPFFSPDAEWVGVFIDTALVKVPTRGGTPVRLATLSDRPAGGAWGDDGTIVFATSEGLYEVPAAGGEPKRLAAPDRDQGEGLYAWPDLLPDNDLLLTVVPTETSQPLRIVAFSRRTLARDQILAGTSPTYSNGRLVYVNDGRLHAVPFDADARHVTGKAERFDDVDLAVTTSNGAASYALSDTGTLVVSSPHALPLMNLTWIDRAGRRTPLGIEPQTFGYARISPDGSRVAVERWTRENRDIWILDLDRLTQRQLTDGPTEDMLPYWSADGTRVFFASNRGGNFDVYSQAADGASPARVEFSGPEFQAPNGVTPDGRQVIVNDRFADLAILDLDRPARLEPLLHDRRFEERLADVSLDGRWIAYESDESGNRFEIVLRSFPDVNGRREIVSTGGGRYPLWGPAGSNELYYVRPDGAMMAVPIRRSPTLSIGRTRKLFDWRPPAGDRSGLMYDVGPDGRFLVAARVDTTIDTSTDVSVILNWAAGDGGGR